MMYCSINTIHQTFLPTVFKGKEGHTCKVRRVLPHLSWKREGPDWDIERNLCLILVWLWYGHCLFRKFGPSNTQEREPFEIFRSRLRQSIRYNRTTSLSGTPLWDLLFNGEALSLVHLLLVLWYRLSVVVPGSVYSFQNNLKGRVGTYSTSVD